MKTKYKTNYIKSTSGQVQICICPKCQRKHKRQFYWTGKGIPKIFCDTCRQSIDTYEQL